jgi:hypothetical protein
MKNIIIITKLIFLGAALMAAGCETATHSTVNDPTCDPITDKYTADRIEIMPLTEIVMDRQTGALTKINTYISLLDAFGYQIKSPAIFRFELYEYLQRSAQQKGKRLYHWQPDLDLNDPQKNNEYWKDFLRAYHFDLPISVPLPQKQILQVTCITPDGRRISAEFLL